MTGGFYRASLKDSDVLYDIIDTEEQPEAIYHCIQQLKNPQVYTFISNTNDAIVFYLPTFGDVPWYSTHSFKKKGASGKMLKWFYIETGLWIIENTPCTSIISVVPDSLVYHGLFLAHCGAKRMAYLDSTTIYAFTSDRLKEFKEKLRCHKHYQH